MNIRRLATRGPWVVCAQRRRSFLQVIAGALMLALGASEAFAQLTRASTWTAITSPNTTFGADAAYDPVNGVYLVVMNRANYDNSDGWLVGLFVDPTGNAVGSEFVIAGDVDFPRAVYSPHVSNGAGGTGGFLVTWTGWPDEAVYARRVAFPGVVIGAASALGPGYGVQEVAYSETSQVFGAAWANYYPPRDASFSRIAANGVSSGVHTFLAIGDAGRSPIYWNSLTDVAWHSARNEFGILYAKQASPWALRFARMTPAGTLLDDRVVATVDAQPIAGALEYSPLTGNYIALWADAVTGRITGMELSATGTVVATGQLPATIIGAQNGMAVAYNGSSGTFLLIGFSQVPITKEQIRGLELNKHGAPNSPVIDVTAVNPLMSNLFAPRVAGRSDAPDWLVNVGASPHYLQIVSTSTVAGGSELRLDGCYNPDPFVTLGGGTCSNGDWLPPADSPGTDTPPPPPPPSTPTDCATPDPFVSLGGGTCYNGGWLPPGMPVPAQTPPAQEPPALPPPPPPPSTPIDCATPDPFVSLGGGTCYNGGWLPPGMPVPNAPAPPPATPPPPAPTQGCTTPDPFVALGGGTCYNGGWLPPGMAVPGGSDVVSPPPPPPTFNDACATRDPFSALPELIGECRNGDWIPIAAITVTGTLSRRVEFGNGWGLVTDTTMYQIVGEVPAEFQVEGLRVSVKGTQPSDVVSVWPVLQVYSIVAR